MTSDLCAKVTGLLAPADAKSLRRLLKSRARRCPELRLLVASAPICEAAGVSWVTTPDDACEATQLNALLARVATPYCLVIPGRGQWQRRPCLEALVRPLCEDRSDLVSGSTIHCRRGWTLLAKQTRCQEHANVSLTETAACLEPVVGPTVEGLIPCDVGSPYLAARTSELRRIGGWDDALLPHEQIELYIRAKRFHLRTAWCPDAAMRVWDQHASGQPPLSAQAVAQMGYQTLTDLEGRQVAAARMSMAA